jgi:hypothetical protein
MASEYINQKVMDSLEEQLIGDYNPENLHRLKMATLIITQGVLPINESFLSGETAQHLRLLEQHLNGTSLEDFSALREHYIAYIMSSQRDEGRRSANAVHSSA